MILTKLASTTRVMGRIQATRTTEISRIGSSSFTNISKNGLTKPFGAGRFATNFSSSMRPTVTNTMSEKMRVSSLLKNIRKNNAQQKKFMSTAETTSENSYQKIFDLSPMNNLKLALIAMIGVQCYSNYQPEGTAFYDYRFIAKKDPDDIAGFYGGEELMELFCVLPIMTNIMLRGAVFDDVGNVTAVGAPGTMHIQMVFSDEYDDDAEQTAWFNKRERFQNTLFGFTLWDMMINYGFTRLPDGRTEVYHQGESFKGYAPPLSLLMKLVFRIHARYVVWAAEHHINHYAFTSESEEQEIREEESRKFALMRLLKEYFVDDVKAMAVGSNKETDSFLTKDEEDPFEDEEEKMGEAGEELGKLNIAKPKVVLMSRRSTVASIRDLKQIIDDDIAFDKTLSLKDLDIPQDALDRMQNSGGEAYQMATLAAMQKRATRIVRRRTSNILIPPATNVKESTEQVKNES